jgi:hypothetical protein
MKQQQFSNVASNNTFSIIVYPGSSEANYGTTAGFLIGEALPKTWRMNYNITGTSPSIQIATANYWYLY